jgi:hypothetical protein
MASILKTLIVSHSQELEEVQRLKYLDNRGAKCEDAHTDVSGVMFQANRKCLLNVVLIPVSGGKITNFSTKDIGLIKPHVDRPSVPDFRMIKVLQPTMAKYRTGFGSRVCEYLWR